jgi:pimeloyl-ACP methyl ester carboxylesterase
MSLPDPQLSHEPDAALYAWQELGAAPDASGLRVVWAHGWGQDRRALMPLAGALSDSASHLLIDFPGFGAAPPPPSAWGTAEYADAGARLLAGLPPVARTIWVGHSFGCRVGLQMAARHPHCVDGLFLIAAAGLPRRRSAIGALRFRARVTAFKALKRAAPLLGLDVERLRRAFGSADYAAAGAMRPVLARVVAEDLSDVARAVSCPVHLVYGENDTETPPEIGERLARLIPGAELTILPRHDHYSVLAGGRHLVLRRFKTFMENG